MLNLPALCAASLLLLLPSLAVAANPATTLVPMPCASPAQRVDAEGFVLIGGIEQWVTVQGDMARGVKTSPSCSGISAVPASPTAAVHQHPM